jgi:hypothetical protein
MTAPTPQYPDRSGWPDVIATVLLILFSFGCLLTKSNLSMWVNGCCLLYLCTRTMYAIRLLEDLRDK